MMWKIRFTYGASFQYDETQWFFVPLLLKIEQKIALQDEVASLKGFIQFTAFIQISLLVEGCIGGKQIQIPLVDLHGEAGGGHESQTPNAPQIQSNCLQMHSKFSNCLQIPNCPIVSIDSKLSKSAPNWLQIPNCPIVSIKLN